MSDVVLIRLCARASFASLISPVRAYRILPEYVEPVLTRLPLYTCCVESKIKNALPHPITLIVDGLIRLFSRT
jgi:hypothetical protein